MQNPELDYITIRGFKSIKAIERLSLRRINLIVGANGSGKSNFIGAFSFLHAIRQGKLNEYIRRAGGAEQILHFGSKETEFVELGVSFCDDVNRYSIKLIPTSDDSLVPTEEVACYWDKPKYKQPFDNHLSPRDQGREAGISDPDAKRSVGWVRERLGRWRLYHVHDTSTTSPLRKTAQVNDNRFLREDGSNLPAFLYLLKQNFPSEYKSIRKTVQLVAPFFDDFNLAPDELNGDSIRISWSHKASDKYFSVSSFSDGTLRFIALATLLLQPPQLRPSIILVDEPELGLHPFAMTILASLIKQASMSTQVILSTQSPQLLDHFEPEDILVADRSAGATHIRRLQREILETWLQDFSLGQLWEKNEFGGRPTSQ